MSDCIGWIIFGTFGIIIWVMSLINSIYDVKSSMELIQSELRQLELEVYKLNNIVMKKKARK